MRALEQAAISSGLVTGAELMERAGRGVVDAVFTEWPDLAASSCRAVVLCGPGNNGGDGFVVARLLKEWGWEVAVFLYGDPEKLPPDARVNYERWCGMGDVAPLTEDTFAKVSMPGLCAIVFDALFGTGLARPVALPLVALEAEPALGQTHRSVAIDIPSGLCSDSGHRIGAEAGLFAADLTVSFHSEKVGHRLADGPGACGKVVVRDIGLGGGSGGGHGAVRPGTALGQWAMEGAGNVQLQDSPGDLGKYEDGHKYAHGHALILSGGAGRTGAARLAARGALRIGAGLVTLGVPGSAQMEVASHVTAIMLKRAGTAQELTTALDDKRINALCLGPGLGIDRAKPLVEAALSGADHRATVLDADALSAYCDDPSALFAMLHKNCVLTPHAGEFRRLFPDISDRLAAAPVTGPAFSKVDATRLAAARAGCVVLFKGADTVIASPDGRCRINSAAYDRAAPWLATAGSGDVLAGFITGLMARWGDPFRAASAGAWLHLECARAFGPGLIAEDLPEVLPKVLKNLGA